MLGLYYGSEGCPLSKTDWIFTVCRKELFH